MDLNKIKLTKHSAQRVRERLKAKSGEELKVIKDLLKNSTYMGVGCDENGVKCYLYINGKVRIMADNDSWIRTVIVESNVNYPLKEKLSEIWFKEIRKLNRKIRTREKYVKDFELNANIELAELKLRLHKTKSTSVKLACEARIKAITETVRNYNREIVEYYRENYKIVKHYQRAL